ADNALSNNWYHLSNANFTIPAGATNMFLVIETVETYNDSSNSGKYVDIYLDEVIIASEGAGIEVDKESGDIRMTNNVKIVSENIPTDIQNSANNWFLDNSWSKTITLEKSKGWTITETNLDELSNRIYQYYVEEVSVPGFTTNYLCTNVSSNTPDSPIIIQNKAIQYTLPPTGGSGTEKYKTAGLILIFVASAAFIIKRKKFDIKKG
ncbi:MAG: Cna B-type domain-containing protein, partial [Oscillospiraceae bacterium]|nr:Cna B-type domain-containing protein [Oscillospiraceae bacterium]